MTPSPTYGELLAPFARTAAPHEVIPADAIPEPQRTLLVHSNHMTVTLDTHYGEPVRVQVLETARIGSLYSRRIVLSTSRGPVQYGVVQIDLNALPTPAVQEILAETTPLGRVLIQNNVLTRVQPVAYLKVTADAELAKLFSIDEGAVLYGRLGVISAAGQPAIDVLEILVS